MIIFLNGCSSAGKSTIARAIQHLSEKPLLLIGIDNMLKELKLGFNSLSFSA